MSEAVRIHGATVKVGLRAALSPPDMDAHALLNGLVNTLAAAALKLRDASEAHQAELDDDDDVRTARDAAAKATYDATVIVRRRVRDVR